MQDDNGGKPGDNILLARQSSIFSLTFDEFQNTLGGPGKDFGSLNMEELLKSIWTAEECQAVSFTTGLGVNEGIPLGNLQRQSSLTLPRTLSQKTVDEVWRDVLKETTGPKEENGAGASNLWPREPTLGEVTLEEFLFRAGVREDIQPPGGTLNSPVISNMAHVNNIGLTNGFQQPSHNFGVSANNPSEHNNILPSLPNYIGNNLNGVNLAAVHSTQQQTQQPKSQLQPLFPKQQTTIAFSTPTTQIRSNGHHCSPDRKTPAITSPLNSSALGGTVVVGGLHNAAPRPSPRDHQHSDVAVTKIDPQSLSPQPFIFPEGEQGRRSSSSLEKVVERRRRRMIKNRESAARSRARKQAYTLELEAEIAKLKEVNEELQRKQDEFLEMQKNQSMETKTLPSRGKRVCLRRTLTGPW